MVFVLQSLFQCKCKFRSEHLIVLVVAAATFFLLQFLVCFIAYDTFTTPLFFSLFSVGRITIAVFFRKICAARETKLNNFTPHECRNGIFPSTFRSFQSSSVSVLLFFFLLVMQSTSKVMMKKTHFTRMERKIRNAHGTLQGLK